MYVVLISNCVQLYKFLFRLRFAIYSLNIVYEMPDLYMRSCVLKNSKYSFSIL